MAQPAADAGEPLTLQRAAYLSEGAAYQSFTLPPLTETLGLGIGTALLRVIEERRPEVARYELFTGRYSAANLRLYRRLGYVDLPDREHPVLVFREKRN